MYFNGKYDLRKIRVLFDQQKCVFTNETRFVSS